MTLRDAIARFDLLYPNAMPLPVKIERISRLDGRIDRELLQPYGEGDAAFAGYTAEDYETAALKAPFPFDDLYVKFLNAENDLVNGDTVRYANSAAVFNAAYEELAAFVSRTKRRRTRVQAETEDLR